VKEFPCGCKFELNDKGNPIFEPYLDKIRFDCPATWDMISQGNTKGIFQLDSNLGQSYAAKTQPNNMEELADLSAIIRPGTKDNVVAGKSLTDHYIDRKHGLDLVEYLHPALEPLLESTYGILVYQEEALAIAKDIAGYNLQEAEILRRAIGKKKVELMAQIKNEFIDKAEANGVVSREDAKEIFSWIEKSQKYSFNKSHAVCYAHNGYLTAVIKAHFPLAFFTSWLRHAKGKQRPQEEIQDLVNNAKIMNIEIMPPSILNMNKTFKLLNDKPTYGLANIKRVGDSVFYQLRDIVRENNYDLSTFTWDQFLMKLGRHIKYDSFQAMITAGALDCYKVSRMKMLYDLELYRDFRESDYKFLASTEQVTLKGGLEEILSEKIPNERRTAHTDKFIELFKGAITSLDNPPYALKDSPSWKAKQERDLLGIELTCTEIDEYDVGDANCTCLEYAEGFTSSSIAMAVKINDVREWKIKNGKSKGQKMAFLKVSDGTCSLDSVTLFSDSWDKYKNDIKINNILLLRGDRDKNRGSFLVKRVQKLT